MKMIKDYVDEAKEKLGMSSYNKLAKHLGWHLQQITKINNGGSISDVSAKRLATVLNIDPIQIIATSHLQRAKNKEIKALWVKLAKEKGNR